MGGDEVSLIQEASLYFFTATISLYLLCLSGVKCLQTHRTVLSAFAGVGFFMGVSAWCEFGGYWEVTSKAYDRDLFVFVCGVFFVVSVCTIRRTELNTKEGHPVPLLSRDQTEEWKGWMQFIFLMYHYFDAKEIYGPIRVLVSAYAFLTGFGNFIYFYKRKDFSFQRFLFMMWRLNFLTVALMCSMHQPYILYYIVPLHTFYFCVTYAIMGVAKSWNHDRSLLSLKLMIAYGIIWFIWDGPICEDIFDWIFFPLKPILAQHGSLHEWHFRSYLDHYSTLFGILVAANLDQWTEFIHFAERQKRSHEIAMKGVVLFLLGLVFYGWFTHILMLPSRFDYNKYHPYFVAVPLITYIYVRNLTPTLRSYHSELCRWFGTLTLETYLMQYHMFLSNNTRSLLAVIPGYTLTNLAITFSVLCISSYFIFGWTLALRNPVCKFSSLKELRTRVGDLLVILAVFLIIAILCQPLFGVGVTAAGAVLLVFFSRNNSSLLFFSSNPQRTIPMKTVQ